MMNLNKRSTICYVIALGATVWSENQWNTRAHCVCTTIAMNKQKVAAGNTYKRLMAIINWPHTLAIMPNGKTLIMGAPHTYEMFNCKLVQVNTKSGKKCPIAHTELGEKEEPYAAGERKAKYASLHSSISHLEKTSTIAKNRAILMSDNFIILYNSNTICVDSNNEFFRFDLFIRKPVKKKHVGSFGRFLYAQGSQMLLRYEETIWMLLLTGIGKANLFNFANRYIFLTRFRSMPVFTMVLPIAVTKHISFRNREKIETL